MGTVGRATTAVAAGRHSQSSQTPGGEQSFPVNQGVGAGTSPPLSESRFALHPEFFGAGCLVTSIRLKCIFHFSPSAGLWARETPELCSLWPNEAGLWHMCDMFFPRQPWIPCHGVKGSSACKVSAITCVSSGLWTDVISFIRPADIWKKTRDSGGHTALSSGLRICSRIFQTKHRLEIIILFTSVVLADQST